MTIPPTARLLPIATIKTTIATGTTPLFDALQYLCALYCPQVRGARRRRSRVALGGNDNADGHDDDALVQVQSDAFERAYAIRWLTALIAQLETRHEDPVQVRLDSSVTTSPTAPHPDLPPITQDTDNLIQQAASLLAICAGVSAAGKVQRQFTFRSPLLSQGLREDTNNTQITQTRIDVLLTDLPLDNHDYASVGAQTWGGACVLAEMIAEHPGQFGLSSLSHARARPLRILELGAGTGLVGLTVAKLLQALLSRKVPDHRINPQATIILTDVYPAVLANLESNIHANFSPVLKDTDMVPIRVYSHPLDWSSFPTMTRNQTVPNLLSTPFDIIFGADIVYEAQHAIWIRDCLASLLAHPYLYPDVSVEEEPTFHLVVPLRPTHTFESSTIEAVFGAKVGDWDKSQRALTILSKESIVCEADGDGNDHRDDDVEYVSYRIGWSR